MNAIANSTCIPDTLRGFECRSTHVFEVACDVFCIGDELNLKEVLNSATLKPTAFTIDNVRLEPVDPAAIRFEDASKGLSKGSNRKLVKLSVLNVAPLYESGDSRRTIMVQLEATDDATPLVYLPGDHLGIFPGRSLRDTNHERAVTIYDRFRREQRPVDKRHRKSATGHKFRSAVSSTHEKHKKCGLQRNRRMVAARAFAAVFAARRAQQIFRCHDTADTAAVVADGHVCH